jgi:hypothetical protein
VTACVQIHKGRDRERKATAEAKRGETEEENREQRKEEAKGGNKKAGNMEK